MAGGGCSNPLVVVTLRMHLHCFVIYLICFYFFEMERDQEGAPICWTTPQMPARARVKADCKELLQVTCVDGDTVIMGTQSSLVPSRSAIGGKLESGAGAGWQTQAPHIVLSTVLANKPNLHSLLYNLEFDRNSISWSQAMSEWMCSICFSWVGLLNEWQAGFWMR